MQFAGAVEVGEERFDLFQLTQTVNLSVSRSTTVSVQRRLWAAVVIAFGVEQIELQFTRHHRVITLGFEAVDDLDQQVAWVGDARWHALGRVHAHLHGGGRNLPPRQAHQAAFQRVGAAVDIADVPDQTGVLDVFTLYGQTEDGARQRPAAFVYGEQFFTVQQRAARHAVGVEDEQFDHVDIGVLFKEQACVFDGCEFHNQSLTMAPHGRADSGRTRRGNRRGCPGRDIKKQGTVAVL